MQSESLYLSIGANLGDPLKNVVEAINLLCERIQHTQVVISSFYQTAPISSIPQPDFINCVLLFTTNMPLDRIWSEIQSIERQVGKVPKSKESPRVIDIDILLYGKRHSVGEIILPHPSMYERSFVLLPLLELFKKQLDMALKGRFKMNNLR